MANHHGNEGKVKVGANTVAEVSAWSYTETCDLAEDTVMMDTAKSYKAGHKDGSGSVTCFWDETDTNGQQAMDAGSTVNLILFPEGDAALATRFGSTTAIIESVTRQGALNGIVSTEFTFRGVLTESTS
jgi:flagellar hook assembly protein FlgD